MKFEQYHDGEPWDVGAGEVLYVACCDCGLVHRVKVTKRSIGLRLRLWTEKRKTAALRRKMNAKAEK